MSHLRPLIGALALATLLAARTAPDLAEELMLSAASNISVAEIPCPAQLFDASGAAGIKP